MQKKYYLERIINEIIKNRLRTHFSEDISIVISKLTNKPDFAFLSVDPLSVKPLRYTITSKKQSEVYIFNIIIRMVKYQNKEVHMFI